MLTHWDAMDLATGERTRRDLTRQAVPIREWTILRPTNRAICLPAVSLDCRRRPDIVDLLRVHGLERSAGDNHTSWKVLLDPQGNSLFVLQVEVYTPANCTFSLAFSPGHRWLLNAIADVGVLFITTRPNMLSSPAIGFDICTDELRQGLIMHDVLAWKRSAETSNA
jgi:hypothetical protein